MAWTTLPRSQDTTADAALSSSGGSGGKKRWGDDSKASSSSMAQYVAVDPSEAEEEVMKGKITFALTAHKEVIMRFFSRGQGTIIYTYFIPFTSLSKCRW